MMREKENIDRCLLLHRRRHHHHHHGHHHLLVAAASRYIATKRWEAWQREVLRYPGGIYVSLCDKHAWQRKGKERKRKARPLNDDYLLNPPQNPKPLGANFPQPWNFLHTWILLLRVLLNVNGILLLRVLLNVNGVLFVRVLLNVNGILLLRVLLNVNGILLISVLLNVNGILLVRVLINMNGILFIRVLLKVHSHLMFGTLVLSPLTPL